MNTTKTQKRKRVSPSTKKKNYNMGQEKSCLPLRKESDWRKKEKKNECFKFKLESERIKL